MIKFLSTIQYQGLHFICLATAFDTKNYSLCYKRDIIKNEFLHAEFVKVCHPFKRDKNTSKVCVLWEVFYVHHSRYDVSFALFQCYVYPSYATKKLIENMLIMFPRSHFPLFLLLKTASLDVVVVSHVSIF